MDEFEGNSVDVVANLAINHEIMSPSSIYASQRLFYLLLCGSNNFFSLF